MKLLPDADSLELLGIILLLIVPGIIIDFVRSQFIGSRGRSVGEAATGFIVVSLVYYSIAFPVAVVLSGSSEELLASVFGWYFLLLIAPALLGLGLGVSAQSNWLQKSLSRFGISTIHPTKSAWDRKFGHNMPGQWVLITLLDGSRVAGWMGLDSYASSDPEERDLYLQRIYSIDDEGNWQSDGKKSVLISGGEVKTVEFWAVNMVDDDAEVQRRPAGSD